ncbi:hypothetical protein AMELA_G00107980 [Ameiurus melas]|uniref:Uncharacterized protein n=1 Tax=Ameiurus melas TaxID=219545 RepID=A0A7J6ASU1_AMEME|nr:hypothetical protein AMELA_G00107980 [Ameiurus melas]
MYFYLGLFLALSTLGRSVLPAPLKDMEVMRSSEFQDAAESALSLVTKIHGEIPAVHKSLIHTMTLSLDESDLSTLQFLKEFLDLPEPSPLQPHSNKFKLDVSLGQIDEGLKLQETLLKVIGELTHFRFKKPKPDGLLYDLRDALLHVHRMQHLIKAGKRDERVSESRLKEDLKPKLEKEYMSQVAAHLTLVRLRQFAEDVSRSLQSMIISPVEQETESS